MFPVMLFHPSLREVWLKLLCPREVPQDLTAKWKETRLQRLYGKSFRTFQFNKVQDDCSVTSDHCLRPFTRLLIEKDHCINLELLNFFFKKEKKSNMTDLTKSLWNFYLFISSPLSPMASGVLVFGVVGIKEHALFQRIYASLKAFQGNSVLMFK